MALLSILAGTLLPAAIRAAPKIIGLAKNFLRGGAFGRLQRMAVGHGGIGRMLAKGALGGVGAALPLVGDVIRSVQEDQRFQQTQKDIQSLKRKGEEMMRQGMANRPRIA